MRFVFIFLALSTNAFAQNLVPNGSFEQYTSLPTGTAQWNRVVSWDNVSGDTACQTPDFFHAQASASSGQQLPNTNYGTIDAEDGEAVMGIGLYMTSSPEYREYISAQLIQPMTVGATYLVRFNAALGANPFHGGASNNLGVAFSVGPFEQGCEAGASGVIPFSPQGENANVVTSFGWELQSYSIVADQAYDRITIGAFRDDANSLQPVLDSTLYAPGTWYGHYGGYYFIDNVSVTKTAEPTGVEDFAQGVFTLTQNPVDRVARFQTSSTKPFQIALVNAQGQLIQSFSTNPYFGSANVDVSNLPNGIYHAQIIGETLVLARFKVVVLH